MRVLVVDDNANMRGYIKKLLIQQVPSIEVLYECARGEDAVEIYTRYRPDWVIMDIRLAGTDGLEATRKIMAVDATANVVFLTDYDEPEYREAAQALGARDFVLKENIFELPRLLKSEKAEAWSRLNHEL
jgi:DNA-binding NarL/FixJ family response regulator